MILYTFHQKYTIQFTIKVLNLAKKKTGQKLFNFRMLKMGIVLYPSPTVTNDFAYQLVVERLTNRRTIFISKLNFKTHFKSHFTTLNVNNAFIVYCIIIAKFLNVGMHIKS